LALNDEVPEDNIVDCGEPFYSDPVLSDRYYGMAQKTHGRIALSSNLAASRASAMHFIPIGMSAANARELLKRDGFD
jgi:hypothetical protein